MNKYLYIICCTAVLTACGGNESSTTEKELELRERELALKEKELALQQSNDSNVENDTSSNNYEYKNSTSTSRSSSQNSSYSAPTKQKSQEELKRDLAMKECETPTNYLRSSNTSLNGTYKNALSMKFDGFKLKFDIRNNASILTFKNIRCRVTLSSNSGSTILSKTFTVSEFLRAGSTITYKGEFECTNQQFNDTDKYSVQILGAECH